MTLPEARLVLRWRRSMSDLPTTRAVVGPPDGGASPPPSAMLTTLGLLIAAIGRCRYCRPPDRCAACNGALATLDAALKEASLLPYADRTAPAIGDGVRNARHSGRRP
jgi:hypothetical protein